MSDQQTKTNPSQARTFLMMAVVEAIIMTAGVAAYLATDNIYSLLAALAVSTVFVVIVLSKVMANKTVSSASPKSGNIVE